MIRGFQELWHLLVAGRNILREQEVACAWHHDDRFSRAQGQSYLPAGFNSTARPRLPSIAGNEELSQLELQILRAIPHVGSLEKLDKVTKVPPATLGREIAKLQLGGYIGDDGRLTEKGLNSIRNQ